MTRPVLNLNSPIARVINGMAFVVSPWNSFFQQFTQQAPAVQNVLSLGSPFTANQNGTVVITGTVINWVRGSTTISLGNGQKVIPVSIGDTIEWTTASAVQFLGN